jgi:hypothetical protein
MKSTCPRGRARPGKENSNTNYENTDNVRNIMKKSKTIKMKNKTYHTVGTAAQSNLKVAERGKVDIPNTYTRHIHIPGLNKKWWGFKI